MTRTSNPAKAASLLGASKRWMSPALLKIKDVLNARNGSDVAAGLLQQLSLIHIFVGVCDSRAWLDQCSFLALGTYKCMVAVRREHPLAAKKRLTLSDLHGQTLMMVKAGDSGLNDRLRAELRKNHPQIQVEDTPRFYDISVFNRCADVYKRQVLPPTPNSRYTTRSLSCCWRKRSYRSAAAYQPLSCTKV